MFRKHLPELRREIPRWLADPHPYTVRFGLGMLLSFYWGTDFQREISDWAAALQREEYYVKMMVAWYFATALAKEYAVTLPYLQAHRLDPWTHNKAIQKAVESTRVSPETQGVPPHLESEISPTTRPVRKDVSLCAPIPMFPPVPLPGWTSRSLSSNILGTPSSA